MNISDKMPPRIMIVDTNDVTATAIRNSLERAWFNADVVNDTSNATKIASFTSPNAVIISSKITTSPLDVAKSIISLPKFNKIPFVFIVDQKDSAQNYFLGDDVCVELLEKNFTPNTLVLTIKSLLRKTEPVFQDKIIKYKNIRLDLSTYKTFKGDVELHLGPTEFKILQLMVKNPSSIYSRDQIIEYVWGFSKDIDHRTVDVHINRLRSVMKGKNDVNQFIKTVRSRGYCLTVPGEMD